MTYVPATSVRVRRFSRRTVLLLVGLVVLAAVAGGWAVWTSLGAHAPASAGTRPAGARPAHHAAAPAASSPGSGSTTGSAIGTGSATVPPLGVYVGPGQAGAAQAVAAEFPGKVDYALDYLPGTTWATLTDPSWLAADWAGRPLDLVLGIPMLPASGATLAAGATGSYDPEFALLAQRLVEDGLGGSVLMIGDQPDDSGTPWYVGSAAAARDYVVYWDDIESTMAAVPGARFVYEWDAGDAGTSPLSPAAMYPGDAAVDVVATDAFDKVPAGTPADAQWAAVLDRRYGPAWMASFAAAHDKPMAIAMWAVVPTAAGGGGDDGAFVTQLLQWATAAKLRMCVLWDYGPQTITGGGFPSAQVALAQALSAEATAADVRSGVSAGTRRDAARTGTGRALRTLVAEPRRSGRGETTAEPQTVGSA